MYYINIIYIILGETDWKIIAIDVNDPLAEELKGKYSIL
jgi:inorganic pyrophosphatase